MEKDVSKFDEEFIKSYYDGNNKGYVLEVDVEYPKNLLNLHGDLPFLSERDKTQKCHKFVCSTHDKEKHVVHIKALKQALYHRLILKKYIE